MKLAIFDLEQAFWDKAERSLLGEAAARAEYDIDFLYLFPSAEGGPGRKLPRSGKIDADIVLIFAYRIPEMCLMLLNPDVRFIYVQHGYYTLNMARTGSGILRKLDRIRAYGAMMLGTSLRKPAQFPQLFKFIRNVWFQAKGMGGESAVASPDTALIQGSFWEDWHKSEIGWKDTTYRIKPYLERKEIAPIESPGAWQYVCQSLVEDGRIDPSEIRTALKAFIAEERPTKLYLATHPRTDRALYADLGVECEFVDDKLYALPTIGHYSSLLIYAKQFGLDVRILPFQDHAIPQDFLDTMNQSPDDIRAYLQYTTDQAESLIWPYL